uniref:Hypothetical LAGLIDADG homing endonuclease n=1 Tax=Bracteacoccus aerius TaxID=50041 RepID=A0A076VFU9_9CHLO|nr:hypothetical LAGLIDADG homing endonuclease [Bracteacoccus aerius]AIK29075.1 hypothetical LAGLIDADG homing endonuclease [Bracteacoccus aerius]
MTSRFFNKNKGDFEPHMPTEVKEMIFGGLLGDFNLPARHSSCRVRVNANQTFSGGKYWRLRILQTKYHTEYVNHMYELLKPWVCTSPQDTINQPHSVTGMRYEKRWFNTVTLEQLKPLGAWFYDLVPQAHNNYFQHKKKLPPVSILEQWLTPRALAYWYMDDGSLRTDVNAVLFSTESFSETEVDSLRQVLLNKYGLKTSRHKKGKFLRIYLSTTSYETFYGLVSPFLIPSIQRKLRAEIVVTKP